MIKVLAILGGAVLMSGSACTGSTTVDQSDGGAGGGAPNCDIDAPGAPLTFSIANTGTRNLFLAYGCGADLPIDLDTDDGTFPIGPSSPMACDESCDPVYGGYVTTTCWDCGPGVGEALDPGQTVAIVWDRRVYRDHVAPAACTGYDDPVTCELGTTLGPTDASTGTLEVCVGDYMSGACIESEAVPFVLDLALDAVSIEVQ